MPMNLPDRVTWGTLEGRIVQAVLDGVDGDGRPEGAQVAGLTIRIAPTVDVLQDPTGGMIVYPPRLVLETNAAGVVVNPRSPSASITLVATDQSWAPAFRYRVTIGRDGRTDIEGYFSLAAGETKNFASLVEWFEPLPESIAAWDVVRAQIEGLRDETSAAADRVEVALDGMDLNQVASLSQDAKNSAASAAGSASAAAGSASAAASSASAAAGSKAAAASSASAASSSASAAAGSATQAAGSATSASDARTGAETAKTAAETARDQAQAAAQTATGGVINDSAVSTSSVYSSSKTESLYSKASHSHPWSQITSKPTTFTPSAHTHSAADTTSGVFSAARLPAPAGMTTPGVVTVGRLSDVKAATDLGGNSVPNLAAVKLGLDELRTVPVTYSHTSTDFALTTSVCDLNPVTTTVTLALTLNASVSKTLSGIIQIGTVSKPPVVNVSTPIKMWAAAWVDGVLEVKANGNVFLHISGSWTLTQGQSGGGGHLIYKAA